MLKSRNQSGVNIQHPISRLILTREKSVETRTYPLPKHYENVEMLLIETPGKTQKFKARVIAKIKFGPSFKYTSKREFYADQHRHRIDQDSPWAWNKKPKWGWPIKDLKPIKRVRAVTCRLGRIYTRNLNLD